MISTYTLLVGTPEGEITYSTLQVYTCTRR